MLPTLGGLGRLLGSGLAHHPEKLGACRIHNNKPRVSIVVPFLVNLNYIIGS